MNRVQVKEFAFYGIKGIDKEMRLKFNSKKKVSCRSSDFEKPQIFGLYGSNCCGKSAFVKAVNLYKDLVFCKDYIVNNAMLLDSLINFKTKEFYLEMVLLHDTPMVEVVHQILVKKIDGVYQICEEKIIRNGDLVVEVSDGMIISVIVKKVKVAAKELLCSSSIMSLYIDSCIDFKEYKKVMLLTGYTAYMVNIFNEIKDNRYYYDKIKNEELKSEIEYLDVFDYLGDVKVFNVSLFESRYLKLCKFIKLFNPLVSDIKCQKRAVDGYYVCRLSLCYDDVDVDFEFESDGIKKLTTIFEMVYSINNGGIVVLDGLDLYLHDKIINGFFEYLISFSKGQLIFTSHNLNSMDTLKWCKNAVSIVDLERNVVRWRQHGNSAPQSIYKKGLLTAGDFKYDELDFYEVFNFESDK